MSWERREEGRRGQRRASWVSGASACPVEGLAWTGLCRGMNVALSEQEKGANKCWGAHALLPNTESGGLLLLGT